MRYNAVDSYAQRSWLEIMEAHMRDNWPPPSTGRTSAPGRLWSFTISMPTRRSWKTSRASRPLAPVQRSLLEALQEKMILDWDFLPLPLNE